MKRIGSLHTGARRFASAKNRLARTRGIALPTVLVLTSMMLMTAAAWLEASIAASRNLASTADQLRAFHAADSVLTLCADMAAKRAESGVFTSTGEPVGWKTAATFDAAALTPVAEWPGAVRPPQCVVESWRLGSRPAARAFLITARGFGRSQSTQAWLQLQVAIEDGHIERRWRRIAARPF